MKRTKKLSAQIKEHITSNPTENRFTEKNLISTGATLLNLAMSDTRHGGIKKGTMINVIGSSHGGKSILALTSFAETNKNKEFEKYAFIYDDVEHANSFDMDYLFGKQTAKRIIPPREDKDEIFSHTVQHFHANVNFWLKEEVPFIYVLDSFDALDSLEDIKKIDESHKALESGKDSAGTYGMSKAKAASSILRNIVAGLSKSESCLVIISQVRDNVDMFSFEKETRAGGRALKFYAHHELWLKPKTSIKRKGKIIGNTVIAKIKKNKITGKSREITFDIYNDYGIDDIGSCVDYLIEVGRWSGGGAKLIDHAEDMPFENCTKSKFVKLVEEYNAVEQLQILVEKEWIKFENSLRLNRKPKYT